MADSNRTLCWFSAGGASAVATRLTLIDHPDAVPVYCETGAEHEDNERFIADCEQWFGRPVERIRSAKYRDTWHVWEKERYLSGVAGAKCTKVLKFLPRLDFQLPSDVHVFGYTSDLLDRARALRMIETYPDLKQRHPLIDRDLDKRAVLGMLQAAGIRLPVLYGLGFQNNNCIPCVKAQSPAYWALVRKHFPAHFERMVRLSRELNVRLAKRDGERIFIDEIAADQPTTDPIVPTCDFLCQIEAGRIEDSERGPE